MSRRALLLVCVLSLLHAAFFIVYQMPDRTLARIAAEQPQAVANVPWTDQGGYQQLGAVLARTGKFTRYPDYHVFVPEVIRTPGYPAFVAAVYLVAGVGNDTAVALAQALVFTLICLTTFAITRRVAGARTGVIAAFMVAAFPTVPYFGALVLTEVWTTLLASIAMLVCIRAAQTGHLATFVVAGVLFGLTTLVRPVFVLLPFFLAGAVPLFVRAHRGRRALTGWAALVVASCVTLLPWFTYNYVHLGRFTLSPAGGIGRGLWEGSWQGRWPGRVHTELTAIADEPVDTTELDDRVRGVARQTGFPAEPMLTYVHEWRDIRAIWEEPDDPLARTTARVVADQEYLRAAIAHISEDPLGHAWRRVTRGTFVLWAADIPIRYTDINSTPTLIIRAIWLVQVGLLLLAVVGIAWLVRTGRWLEAVVLTLPLVYVTGVHLPLLCEARQSLPVKPLVIALAAIALTRPKGVGAITSPGNAGS
jgi:4-amino-4-deoxy-L-arabinose transferase-like glycosyltransferase